MKIVSAKFNNRRKTIEVASGKQTYSLPFTFLKTQPTKINPIINICIDKEVGGDAIAYNLKDGSGDTIHLDIFLEYNKDPKYISDLLLYNLTIEANKTLKQFKLSKRELARKLKTSPSQLYRLLDPTNYNKTLDHMIKLIIALNLDIEITTKTQEMDASEDLISISEKFPFIDDNQLINLPLSSQFKPMGQFKLKEAS